MFGNVLFLSLVRQYARLSAQTGRRYEEPIEFLYREFVAESTLEEGGYDRTVAHREEWARQIITQELGYTPEFLKNY